MENHQGNHARPTDVANVSWRHHDGRGIVRNQRQGSEQENQGWVQDPRNARHLRSLLEQGLIKMSETNSEIDHYEQFRKTLGLRWLVDKDEYGTPGYEIGVELVPNGFPQELLIGKIQRVQVYNQVKNDDMWVSEEGTVHDMHVDVRYKWKVVIEVYAGYGETGQRETKAIHMNVADKQHGVEIVKYYYNLILFGEKDLGFIEDPNGQQAWFDKEPF